MKKHLLTLGLILIVIGLILSANAVMAQNSNEFTVPLSDPAKRGKLRAHLNYGSITVKGTARKDVLIKYKSMEENGECEGCDVDVDVDVDVKKNRTNVNTNRTSETKSKEGLKKIGGGGMDLEVVESDNYVKVKSDSWKTKMDVEIEVPAGFDLDVDTYNDGKLVITDVEGDLELKNYNGDISAQNISGTVIATTYNGEVKASFNKVKENTPMSFSTFNGDIDLTFPAALKATLKMKTERGEIYTGFDVKILSSAPVQKKDAKSGVYKVTIDDWKRGDVNGGGAEITMKNYNGDIYVRKK